jgi:hypothetical protein
MLVKARPAAPPPTWAGFYIRINGGGAWGSVDPSATDGRPDSFFAGGNIRAVTAGASQSFKMSGALAGGQHLLVLSFTVPGQTSARLS